MIEAQNIVFKSAYMKWEVRHFSQALLTKHNMWYYYYYILYNSIEYTCINI